MEKILNKKDLDKCISLSKKYFRTGDLDYLPALRELEEKLFGEHENWCSNVISSLTIKGCHSNYNEPYATYYKVFEALGFKIVEEND